MTKNSTLGNGKDIINLSPTTRCKRGSEKSVIPKKVGAEG